MMILKIICVLLILFVGCESKPQILTPEKYKIWVRDPQNNLHQTKKLQNLILSLQYLPADYMKLMAGNLQTDASTDTYSFTQQITFSLSVDVDKEKSVSIDPFNINARSFSEVEERKKTFTENIEQNVSIRCGKQILKPALCVADISNGLVNSKTVFLAFEKPKEFMDKGIEIIWNDMVFRTGVHKFYFSSEDLANIPTLDKGQQ